MTQSDQPRPRLGRDLLVIAAGVLLCWFALGSLGAIGGVVALTFSLPGKAGLATAIDLLALAILGRALGDFCCGVVLGRCLRRINPWYVLPCIGLLDLGLALLPILGVYEELPRVPLPVIPLILVEVFVTGAGIKLGRHWRGLADSRRDDSQVKRPWFQFRLRTLMLFVLLCSVLLGSWYALFEPFRRRDRLITSIEERWGTVRIEDDGPPWLSRLLGKRYTGSVVSIGLSQPWSPVQLSEAEIVEILESTDKLRRLSLSDTPITDEGLACLRGLSRLEDLSLLDTTISGDGLRHLKALPALLHLDLGYSEITEESLVHLEPLANLQSLSLIQVQVGDEGLVHLEPLRKLSWLFLSETDITDKGLVHLREMHNLEGLLLDDTQISGEGFAHLTELKRLRHLSLTRTQLTDAALRHFGSLTGLETLWLRETQINGQGLAHLRELKKLKELWLQGTNVDDRGLANLAALSGLKELSLDNTQVTDAGLKYLATLPDLEDLSLSGTRITDTGLHHFRAFDRLERLSLDGTLATEERLLELDEAMPDCEVDW